MKELSPVDLCGCGDTGYLTTRTIPVDLIQGVGHIHRVPIYHCGNKLCDEYALPSPVVARIDDLAEIMEQKNLNALEFYWENQQHTQDTLSLLEAFTWKFTRRKYEDAEVVLVIPGQSIVLQSHMDESEFYEIKYLTDAENENRFSFLKFYSEEPLTYEKFLDFEPTYSKELGVLALDDVEAALVEEFGDEID